RTRQAAVAESKVHLLDFLQFPSWEASHRTVIQVAARDSPLQAVGYDAARQCLVLLFPDPKVVAPDRRLICLQILENVFRTLLVVSLRVAAEHLGVDVDNQAPFRWLNEWGLLASLDQCHLGRHVIAQGLLKEHSKLWQGLHTVIAPAQELAVRGGYIHPLEWFARCVPFRLSANLAEEILLTSVWHIPVDRGGDEPRFEKLDNLRIVKGRRTVDDAVVSDTGQWVAGHGPEENWFLFRSRQSLRFKERQPPRNRPPDLVF